MEIDRSLIGAVRDSGDRGLSRIHSLEDIPVVCADIRRRVAQYFSEDDEQPRQVACFMEEAGEFVGAWRRYYGWARRGGNLGEVSLEWADVIIAAFIAAEVIGIDPLKSLDAALEKIYTRGWKDAR